MKKRKEKMLKTLFFIGIMMSIILTGTLCMAASGEIDVDRITIGEDNIEDLKPMFENMWGFVRVIGSAISVIVIVVIGIKYIWASTEEKFEIKQTVIYYVIGAVLLFATVNIVSIVYDIFW